MAVINLNFYLILFLIMFHFTLLEAKTAGDLFGNGHSGDIAKVLGINLEDRENNRKIEKLVKVFADSIDGIGDANELNRKIKDITPNFNWGGYGHRLFFHWGFNKNPQDSIPLSEKVNEATEDPYKRKMIWELIIKYQSERNRKMKSVVYQLGAMTKDENDGISTLIYDIHLLGDYIEGTETTSKALLNINSIIGDLNNAFVKLNCSNYNYLREIKKEMNSTIGSDKMRAEKILQILKNRVPNIIQHTNRVKKALYGK